MNEQGIQNRPQLVTLLRDLSAGMVVFFVALPLCLGIAVASGAPPVAGLVSGIIGGVVVGILSGSHTSVSGPAAGMVAIVVAQISTLKSYEAFLAAVVIAGLLQIAMSAARAGIIAAFFPNSVLNGLLGAIGMILVLKQIPHLLGHDTDPEGDMAFAQPDHQNTFTELGTLFYGEVHLGAALIGITSVAIIYFWEHLPKLKGSLIPAPLVVVLYGLAVSQIFRYCGDQLSIGSGHLIEVPVATDMASLSDFFKFPMFSKLFDSAVFFAGVTVALVASLETLLNLEAIDKLDPKQRVSPGSRELFAQGIGNICAGLIGGLPITSVVVRSSVNINSGSETKLSAIIHGVLLLLCVMLLPQYLNLIPMSCLAAILFTTGIKLASPKLFVRLWKEGRYQFIPFIITLVAIVLTDLLNGILIGLAVSLSFILNSSFRQPLRQSIEKHLGGDVLRVELSNQVSFLNRAVVEKALRGVPRGGHVLLDASRTDYIDPDILGLIRDFRDKTAVVRGVKLSLYGFRQKYNVNDHIQFVDYTTRDLQQQLTPAQVLRILRDGNDRFRSGRRLSRDLARQVQATADGQHPIAAVLSCIDSRTPAELIFDLGLGDIFSIRIAGNIVSPKVLGSMEFGTAIAGAKLILVVGHTRCGAVNSAVQVALGIGHQPNDCQNMEPIMQDIRKSIDMQASLGMQGKTPAEFAAFADVVARRNVQRVVQQILEQSQTIEKMVRDQRLAIAGAMYDVSTAEIEIQDETVIGLDVAEVEKSVRFGTKLEI